LLALAFKSIAILIPVLSVSSRTSDIPSTFLSILRPSILATQACLLTSKGISVIIICSLPFSLTNSYLA